jgi:hypothetical protein
MIERGYVVFQSSKSQFPYTFLYPAGWKTREIIEKGYTGVFIAGPRNQAGTFSVSFTVGVMFGMVQTAKESATAFVSSHRLAFDCQELGQVFTTVAGNPAVVAEIAYSMPLPLNSVKPQDTLIRERRVFFKRNSHLYELDYAAPEEDYETWLGAFRTLVESFAFAEKPTDVPSYRPMATAVPQPVREESPGYGAKENQSDGDAAHHQS